MSLLVREDIVELMMVPAVKDRLIITPLLEQEKQIGPASVDVRLGTEFIEPDRRLEAAFDPVQASADRGPKRPANQETLIVPLGESIVLHPGAFLLGCTLEFIQLPAIVGGQVLSRSSWGRIGLIVATAATIQPGYSGMVTLELTNLGSMPIKLYPGMRVAQLVLWRAAEPTKFPYVGSGKAKYDRPLGPQSSRLSRERDELDTIRNVGSKLGVHER